MELSPRLVAALDIGGSVCDVLGGLYLAYDAFRRHAGPLGFLTRAATYSVVVAVPGWIGLGARFGAIAGVGLGSLIAGEYWLLARRQRLARSSPLRQAWWSGLARGVVIGLAAVPRFGWRFGSTLLAAESGLLALVYGAGLVPTYRFWAGRFVMSRPAFAGAVVRVLAMGVAATIAAAIAWGPKAAERFGPLITLLTAFAALVIVILVPYVEYWTEHAPDTFFIFAGLSLLFLGLVCDTIPSLVLLLTP